jgi:hypothetical protein
VPPEDPPEQSIVETRQQIEELLQEFRAAQQARTSTVLERREIPRRLYHYTTLSGLVGITSNSLLWASDVRYMNDASELTYAAELISEVLTETLSGVENEVLRAALPAASVAEFANPFAYGIGRTWPFAACFCEDGDLLSQWRGYRGAETGYALGMDLHGLVGFGWLPPYTLLRPVVYDSEEQRSEVRDVVEVWLRTAGSLIDPERGLDAAEVFPYPALWALQDALAEHHLRFKHPEFAEEQEWRLIKLVDVREELNLLDRRRRDEMRRETAERMRQFGVEMPDIERPDMRPSWGQTDPEGVEIKFRSSPIGLVPYVELPLRERAGVFIGRLPLWHVVQGPTPNPELSLESMGMYLQSRGYGFHTELTASGIPLRH